MKLVFRVAISLLLTGSFIYLFARRFDVGAAGRALREASPLLVGGSLLVNLAAYLIRAWRWRVLMAPVKKRIGMYNLTSTMFIGFMVSFLVPFRLGEVVRPVLLARREKVSTTATIATVALERLFDVMTVMALLLVYVLTSRGADVMASGNGAEADQAAVFVRHAVVGVGALVAVALPLVIVLVLFPKAFARPLKALHGRGHGGIAARISGTIEKLVAGLGVMRSRKRLAQAVALSFLMWLVIDWSILLGVRAFNLPLQFSDSLLLVVPLGVGIVMPTPGGVGPYEYLCQVSLAGFWNVDQASAAAAAITLHAVTLLPTIALGLLFMWMGGVRMADFRKMARIKEGAGP
ncbi:MAG TPA: lysylphosphatidylglycerol synthase transmembrane domain-containing protein [Candidatus Binatia bacterium]|nr:lysylphosphatidylglycerol synthase transmembrane domain-containing protein [Candidatus Binatia bacterium]